MLTRTSEQHSFIVGPPCGIDLLAQPHHDPPNAAASRLENPGSLDDRETVFYSRPFSTSAGLLYLWTLFRYDFNAARGGEAAEVR